MTKAVVDKALLFDEQEMDFIVDQIFSLVEQHVIDHYLKRGLDLKTIKHKFRLTNVDFRIRPDGSSSEDGYVSELAVVFREYDELNKLPSIIGQD